MALPPTVLRNSPFAFCFPFIQYLQFWLVWFLNQRDNLEQSGEAALFPLTGKGGLQPDRYITGLFSQGRKAPSSSSSALGPGSLRHLINFC